MTVCYLWKIIGVSTMDNNRCKSPMENNGCVSSMENNEQVSPTGTMSHL